MILHAISGEAPQFIAFSDKLLTNQECKSLTSVKRGNLIFVNRLNDAKILASLMLSGPKITQN